MCVDPDWIEGLTDGLSSTATEVAAVTVLAARSVPSSEMVLQRAVRAHTCVSEGDQVTTLTLKAFSSFGTILLLWSVGRIQSAFEGVLQQCPAMWEIFQGLPAQSIACLSSTNRCLHSFVRGHLPSLVMVWYDLQQ